MHYSCRNNRKRNDFNLVLFFLLYFFCVFLDLIHTKEKKHSTHLKYEMRKKWSLNSYWHRGSSSSSNSNDWRWIYHSFSFRIVCVYVVWVRAHPKTSMALNWHYVSETSYTVRWGTWLFRIFFSGTATVRIIVHFDSIVCRKQWIN